MADETEHEQPMEPDEPMPPAPEPMPAEEPLPMPEPMPMPEPLALATPGIYHNPGERTQHKDLGILEPGPNDFTDVTDPTALRAITACLQADPPILVEYHG